MDLYFLFAPHAVVTVERQTFVHVMASLKLDNVQLIKKSIACRAKYRLGQGSGPTFKTVVPSLVVPHPKNRGGDPVKSLRTLQLSGTIAVDGFDPIEAGGNAVAVEQDPSLGAKNSRWRSFQEQFEEQIKSDPDMADKIMGISALIGSLSHGHLNCVLRNMVDGKNGCECAADIRGSGECKCPNSPIVNQDGYYCIERLRVHDTEWANLCEKGISWEMLSHRMDIEDPEAALIISVALNKKNEASMKTSHTEIMNTLVGLCKPSPDGKVPFEPLREKMIELYGAAVDHPDFHNAFRVVMAAGGADSPHMKDLHEFTKVYVNPKITPTVVGIQRDRWLSSGLP